MLYRDARRDEGKEGNGDTEEHDRQLLVSLRHSVNGDFCGHSRFVLWHENLTTFVS